MKTLLLARHADPVFVAPNVTDFLIPISDTGRIKQKNVCEKLKKLIPSIDTIYSSPLLRAKETAEVIQRTFSSPLIEFDSLGMPFSQEKVRTLIKSLPEQSTTCFVGHGPTISWILRQYNITLPEIQIGRSCVAAVALHEDDSAELLFYLTP